MPEKSAFSRLKLVRTDDLPPPPIAPSLYIELGVTSPFSFLRGASDANELVPAALGLGYDAIGIADRNTLAGVVRMHSACTAVGIKPLIGCRLDVLGGVGASDEFAPTPSALRASSPPASGRGMAMKA